MLQSPFSSEVLRRVREQIAALLPDRDAALEVPGGQPFFLHLLSQSLEILGDPDYRILDHGDESFAEGVPLGWDRPLPRTPQVFPKRTTFRKLDQTDFEPSMLNYRSAEMNADQLEEKFREDERAGLMLCTTEAEATQRFGAGALLAAAMGALHLRACALKPFSFQLFKPVFRSSQTWLRQIAAVSRPSNHAPLSPCRQCSGMISARKRFAF